ncbi:MAG: hypothetical protein EON93_08430 [Burkholderiales bacterium]|nr:MAG: hypothetical protein EON93_08430 [Burkholderiales bacterium]
MAAAGNAAAASGAGWSLMRRHGHATRVVAAGVLLIGASGGLAIAPAVAEHVGHYAARAEIHHRFVLEEILAQPLCSGREAAR